MLHKNCLKEWGYRIGLCVFSGLTAYFISSSIKNGYTAYINITINMPLFFGMSLGLYVGLYNNLESK